MPLGFQSMNKGIIAFGFFNIDTDLLLMERYFIFATEFCQYLSHLAEYNETEPFETSWDLYYIENKRDVGDLRGAINGTQYAGFIGEVYRRYPFPEMPEDFKQKANGFQNRAGVQAMIARYASKTAITFRLDREDRYIRVGEYLFSRGSFQKIIQYVWLGGYPRWKDGVRPAYVLEMKRKIEKSQNWLFSDFYLAGASRKALKPL